MYIYIYIYTNVCVYIYTHTYNRSDRVLWLRDDVIADRPGCVIVCFECAHVATCCHSLPLLPWFASCLNMLLYVVVVCYMLLYIVLYVLCYIHILLLVLVLQLLVCLLC